MHEMQSPMMRSVRQLLQGWAWGSHDVDVSVDRRRRLGRRRGAVLVRPEALLPQLSCRIPFIAWIQEREWHCRPAAQRLNIVRSARAPSAAQLVIAV